jgi:hypothetical protein
MEQWFIEAVSDDGQPSPPWSPEGSEGGDGDGELERDDEQLLHLPPANPGDLVCREWKAGEGRPVPVVRGGFTWTVGGEGNLYLFGGADMRQEHFQDVWVFNVNAGEWEEMTHRGGLRPTARSGHSAVFLDPHTLVVYGGMNAALDVTYNDVLALDISTQTWSLLASAKGGNSAPPRNSHSAALAPDGETMVIFGGAAPDGPTDSVWTASSLKGGGGLRWHEQECRGEGPGKREMHASCVVNRFMVVQGGRRETGQVVGDTYLLDMAAWAWSRLADCPVPRCSHTISSVPPRRRRSSSPMRRSRGVDGEGAQGTRELLLFGGWDGDTTIASDIFALSVKGGEGGGGAEDAWREVELQPEPDGRFGHCTCTCEAGPDAPLGEKDGWALYTYGGISPGGDMSGVLVISPSPTRPSTPGMMN